MSLPRLDDKRHYGFHLGYSLSDHLFWGKSATMSWAALWGGPGDEKPRPSTSNPISEELGADLQALVKLSDDYSPSQQFDYNLLRDHEPEAPR